jgi:hypothetical protein
MCIRDRLCYGCSNEVTDTEGQLREWISTLSSDEFEGRKPGTNGGQLTKNYIADQLKKLSIEPLDFLKHENNTLSAQKAACDDTTCENSSLKKYKLQIHHIIPLGTLTKIGENSEKIRKDKTHILNSPLNLTYISECANSKISDMDYEKYASELKHKIETHFLTPEKIESKKDIENMLTKRYENIKGTIIREINSLLNR